MIRTLKIEAFRGIAHGELTDLPRLALLTGPNGSGKSTVLEALQVAAGYSPGDSIGRVVRRRVEVSNGARWLLHRGDYHSRPVLKVTWDDGRKRDTKLWVEDSTVTAKVRVGTDKEITQKTYFQWQNNLNTFEKPDPVEWSKKPWPLRFLDQGIGRPRNPLSEVYSQAVLRSPLAFLDVLRSVDPTILDLRILEEVAGAPNLHLIHQDGRSVPAALAGDGVESLLRLALEFSMREKGTYFVEEPEAHQHTAAVVQTAKVLVAAARRGCQVILTTHSMELLDAMLFELEEDERKLLAVYRTRLVEGSLRVLRVAGEEVGTVRADIGADLR